MANKYYAPGEHRAARVVDLFATIAPRYDLINDLQSFGLHRLWKRQLIDLSAPKRGEKALDLCCGTGDIAFSLAARGADVVGLDFSEPMLNVARRRASIPNTSTPWFLQGDAQEIPFPESSFDIVTVGYGLRNLTSWQQGLRGMWRVARSGGRLLVLDFGKPDSLAWRAAYFAYLRTCVPVLGRLFCGDSQTHAYILESLHHYPAQHGIAQAMRELGCRDVHIVSLLGGIMTINLGIKS